MYHPTSRVLAVLELLQSNRRMTGAELAQRLEVNIRTARRYITILQDIGIPIVAERGRYGAYELEAGFRLPPMIFNDEEALVLEIGLLAVYQLGLEGKHHAIESARSKLERALPLDLKDQAMAAGNTIQLELDTHSSKMPSQILLTVSYATYHHCRLEIQYRTRTNEENERLFDPFGIACLQGLWYVVGWCHLRDALRSFRLDRIIHIKLIEETFECPPDFDALAYIEASIATLPRKYAFDITLETSIERAHEVITNMFGTLTMIDEQLYFQGTVDDLPWLARQLACFPFPFIIHEPTALQSALRAHAQELLLRLEQGK